MSVPGVEGGGGILSSDRRVVGCSPELLFFVRRDRRSAFVVLCACGWLQGACRNNVINLCIYLVSFYPRRVRFSLPFFPFFLFFSGDFGLFYLFLVSVFARSPGD
ncbi:unnamed protein product [Ectocarpus sp. 8 AP-2014]